MDMSAAISHYRRPVSDCFEPVPDSGRYLDETIVVLADEKLGYLASGLGVFPIIINYQLYVSDDTRIVQGGRRMLVPAFYGTGVYAGAIDLAELNEMRRVFPQHVIDCTTILRDALQGNDFYSINHDCPL